MKRILFTLIAVLTMALPLEAISYTQARDEALFITDKMAYELNLSQSQYDAVYEINLDYMMSLNYSGDVSGTCWTRRNLDLSYVLTAAQYAQYTSASYFYRPVSWNSGWRYNIYSRYTNRSTYYFGKPTVYTTYKGAHSWANNGNKSWYRGKTYDSKTAMKPVSTGTKNHSASQGTASKTQNSKAAGSSSGSWRKTTSTGTSTSLKTTSRTTSKTARTTKTTAGTAKTTGTVKTTSKSGTTSKTANGGQFGNGR